MRYFRLRVSGFDQPSTSVMEGLNNKMAKKIFSQEPQKYILALAEALKEVSEFNVPEWANFVKSGTSKERPPIDKDFWYIRSASILRQLYIKGVVGVERLRTRYGCRKSRGTKPDEFRKASGKIIRTILQQAEKAGFVEKVIKLQFGRRLTDKGKEFLDSINIETKEEINYESFLVHNSEKKEDVNLEQEDFSEDGQ